MNNYYNYYKYVRIFFSISETGNISWMSRLTVIIYDIVFSCSCLGIKTTSFGFLMSRRLLDVGVDAPESPRDEVEESLERTV